MHVILTVFYCEEVDWQEEMLGGGREGSERA